MSINIVLYSIRFMISASFARPTGLFDNVFNRFVSWLTGGDYCHSEFIFTWDIDQANEFFKTVEGHDRLKNRFSEYVEDGKVNICFYVLWGDKTSYRLLKHTSNNPFYRMPNNSQFTVLPMTMDQENEFKIATFLLDQCKKEYDYAGALTYYIPLRNSQQEYSTYFCSQLMICALQHVQQYRDVNPSSVTPNKLYDLLSV